MDKIGIIGGGIAGLSLAYNLEKLGIPYKLFERADQIRENGLGFLIMNNGIQMFKKMGIYDDILKNGNKIKAFYAIKGDGSIRNKEELGECLAISREKCIKAVYNQVNFDNIYFNKTIQSILQKTNGQSTLVFEDGSSETFDLIVGADGSNSFIRNLLFPKHKSIEIKEKEIVCKIHSPRMAAELGHKFLKFENPKQGINMGLIAINKSELVWFIQLDEHKQIAPKKDMESLKQFALKATEEAPYVFKRAISKSDFKNAYFWKMFAVDLLPSFYKNNIVLIGDAAHPLLAFTSQGVNSALDDSYLLAQLIANLSKSSKERILKQYDIIRRPVIDSYIKEGLSLLDQFYNPENYSEFKTPYVQANYQKTKHSSK